MNSLYTFFTERKNSDDLFLPFFRISCSLFFLLHFLSVLPDFQALFGSNGIIPSELGELYNNAHFPALSRFVHLFPFEEQTSFYIFQSIYIIACLTLLVGFCSRASAIILLSLHILLANGAHLFMYGVDAFTTIAMFYCCVFPVGAEKSIDEKLFYANRKINPTIYRRILQIHICLVYCNSGMGKIIGFNWWNGESIWRALHLPFIHGTDAINYDFLGQYPLLSLLLGWGTVLLELLYPIFVWKNPYKKIWLTLVITLHVSIMIALNLYFFSTLMIILNLSAFLNLENKNADSRSFENSATKRNKVFIGWGLTHLTLILFMCIYSVFEDYDRFYKFPEPNYKRPVALSRVQSWFQTPILIDYLYVGGIDAAYNFFAPNVASPYIIEFKLMNQNNEVVKNQYQPTLKSNEGRVRFGSMLGNFQDKLKLMKKREKDTTLYGQYLDVIVKSLSRSVLKEQQQEDICKVKSVLYVYNYPSLKDFTLDKHEKQLIPLDSFLVMPKKTLVLNKIN